MQTLRRPRWGRWVERAAPIATVAGLGLLLAACGGSVQAAAAHKSAPVRIVLWESHNGGPVGGAMSALVSKFDASHKSVQVSIDVTKASSKLFAAIAAGTSPVLAEISHYDGQFVKANALVSWNRYIDQKNSPFTSGTVYPAVFANGEVKGQHYRLQADVKVSEVFYNASLFQQAGITSAPTTWTQLAADAATIKAKLPGVIPLGWKDSSAHILPAFMSNGGTMLAHSNTTGTSVDFANTAGTATFSYFRSLYASGEMIFGHGTELRADLGAGKIAMIDGTSAGYQKVLIAAGGKFKVGAFVEPAGTSGYAANMVQGLGFVLPKGHTRAQDAAAWTFVSWWFQPAQQAHWAEQTGFDPETRSAASAISASFLRSHSGLAASIAAAKSVHTFARPISDSYNEVQASLDTEFFNAVTGKQSVASALASLDQQGNGYMSGASGL